MRDFDALLERVNKIEKLRVWSLIMTFFGDAVVPRGGVVSARSVGLVMGRLGIEAGAVRTAFSRLASDGWVIREKTGRNAFYRLSKSSAETFDKAAARIYAPRRQGDIANSNWLIAITERDSAGDMAWAEQFEGLCLASNIAIFCEPNAPLREVARVEECLMLEGNSLSTPPWLKHWVEPENNRKAYLDLIKLFNEYSPKNNLDAIAARTLLIHQWRRLLLRTPNLPNALFSKDWPGFTAREMVGKLYQEILPQSESWLNNEIKGQNPDMSGRFT